MTDAAPVYGYDLCASGAPIKTTTVIITGLAFMQNLRRGRYELGVDMPRGLRIAAAFTELAFTIWCTGEAGFTVPTTIRPKPPKPSSSRR